MKNTAALFILLLLLKNAAAQQPVADVRSNATTPDVQLTIKGIVLPDTGDSSGR